MGLIVVMVEPHRVVVIAVMGMNWHHWPGGWIVVVAWVGVGIDWGWMG